ncbi:unnamed protein product [Oppiella nova]|uniref:Short-chain dehydrogenase/reductase n=1 Tax=Oppiella nova TaxID=334625 RepID=A0A7R9MDF0_9ACAR|nr:unnamed protein product [Oppiella nova]CAG2175299.1 unnamed protein product [Oppiella nova]
MFWRKISPKDKSVLITGCDSGFGNRLAFRLNELGFRVYATVLSEQSVGAQDLTTKCKFADNMCVLEMNVTKEDQINRCYDFVESDLQKNGCVLWAVVNNAGVVTYGHTEWGPFDEITKTFDVNVFGVIRVTRKFTPLIRLSQGRIVIVASLGGRLVADNLGVYCMSKFSIIAYSDALRREMRKFKVKVSTIEPLLFKTAMYEMAKPSLDRNWMTTDDTIREAYGEHYFAHQLKVLDWEFKIGMGTKNLDIVVNDMIAAVVSVSPNRRYTPVNRFMFKIIPPFIPLLPQWIVDRVFYAMNTKPAFVNKTKQNKI